MHAVPRPASEGRPARRTSPGSPRSRPAPTSGSASTTGRRRARAAARRTSRRSISRPATRLSFDAPAGEAFDSYVSDPAKPGHLPRRAPTSRPGPRARPGAIWLVDDQRFAEARPDVLTYSSAPLTQPLRLAGTPLVHLVASTSGTDSDWVVKLIDVYPDQYPQKPELGGYQLAIAMDVIRGRYRDRPGAPLAGARRTSRSLTNSRCPAVDYVVQPGHRLMVQVQSSWFPLYDRNPQTFVPNIFFAKAARLPRRDAARVHRPRRHVDRPSGRQVTLRRPRRGGYLARRPRSVAQLVEHRSPKPRVVGSSPSAPASQAAERSDSSAKSCEGRPAGEARLRHGIYP